MADAVDDGLRDLTDDIDFWNRQMRDYQRQDGDISVLNRYVVELYVVVFEFLTEIFDKWSKNGWTRLVSSFDEGIFNRIFKEKRSRIDAIAARMKAEVELHYRQTTVERLQDVTAKFEKFSHDTEMRSASLEAQSAFQTRLLLALGINVQHLLQGRENAMQFLLPPQPFQLNQATIQTLRAPSPELLSVPRSASAVSINSDDTHDAESPGVPRSRTEILGELRELQEEYGKHMSAVAKLILLAKRLQIDPVVQKQLLRWIGSSTSNNLWVSGPHGVTRPSQNTLTAINLVALSKSSKIACLAYFCGIGSGRTSDTSPRSVQLLKLVLSIIIQILLVVPEDADLTGLSPDHIAALRGRTMTISEALLLIRLLRNAAPQFVHIIVDGIRSLEDPTDRDHNLNLINTIGTLCTLDSEDRTSGATNTKVGSRSLHSVTKVCFTTDGHADPLARLVGMKLLHKTQYDIEATDLRAGDVANFNGQF